MTRLITKELIPDTLWDSKASILHLPPSLISGWKALLEKNALLDQAMTIAPDGFEGGMSKVDTDNHFAWRFAGSCARVMLSILDPKQELRDISDVFTRFFSGNRVILVDLPCGSGAASLAILSVYCELRKHNLVPREPLEVVVVGGELSKFAQCYAQDGLTQLKSKLEEQAIALEFDILDWDVCDRFSNADLLKYLTLKSQGCSAKVMLLANFSGFLQRNKKWNDANPQIDEIFRFNRGQDSVALWIEPNRNDVTKSGGFIIRLIEWFKEKFSALLTNINTFQETSVEVQHPLIAKTFRVNLVVVRFDLPVGRPS